MTTLIFLNISPMKFRHNKKQAISLRNYKASKSIESSSDYKKTLENKINPPYCDDGWRTYPEYRRGFKCNRSLLSWMKRREYRSWKYNRLTKYK